MDQSHVWHTKTFIPSAELTWVQSVDDGLACAQFFLDLKIQKKLKIKPCTLSICHSDYE